MDEYDMTEFEAEWIECLYESPTPAISAWREDGRPEGPRYVLRQVEGLTVPHEWIGAAMRAILSAVAGPGRAAHDGQACHRPAAGHGATSGPRYAQRPGSGDPLRDGRDGSPEPGTTCGGAANLGVQPLSGVRSPSMRLPSLDVQTLSKPEG